MNNCQICHYTILHISNPIQISPVQFQKKIAILRRLNCSSEIANEKCPDLRYHNPESRSISISNYNPLPRPLTQQRTTTSRLPAHQTPTLKLLVLFSPNKFHPSKSIPQLHKYPQPPPANNKNRKVGVSSGITAIS